MKLLCYCSCEAHTYQARHVGQDFVINELIRSKREAFWLSGHVFYYASTGVAHLITHPAVQVPRDAFKHRHGIIFSPGAAAPTCGGFFFSPTRGLASSCCVVRFLFLSEPYQGMYSSHCWPLYAMMDLTVINFIDLANKKGREAGEES
jgi:hypothetical protein